MNEIREDAYKIIRMSINEVLPEKAVQKALENKSFTGSVIVIAIGKAAWNMANAAKESLGSKIVKGLVVTKYEHSRGPIEGFEIIEAGHPIPDENSVIGAARALEMVKGLSSGDEVIFLISGGGSSIFEKPAHGITLEDIMDITNQLLSSGADIVEINTIRKHLSDVKGGRFAEQCLPAKVFSIVLSDVIGDRLDSIASGPAYPDSSTSVEALEIINKYKLKVKPNVIDTIKIETPKEITNTTTVITGSVTALCEAALKNAEILGYEVNLLTTTLDCEAKEAGKFLAAIAREANRNPKQKKPCAWIAGGETVVKIIGSGKGGRNQELALAAAIGIDGWKNTVIFSVGSDGTDGPTDAAGGMVDGETVRRIKSKNASPYQLLENNDSYHALSLSGDLIKTGSTGTNVNDLMMILFK
ncbi:MAG: glycerate kinase [Clostridiales bacterium]|nr:glycerate kinase [Clostridiales bacterium]